MFWLRKPKKPNVVINGAASWPGDAKYEFDRWVVISPTPLARLAKLDAEMFAEEKSHPSCMWDWISPNRLRSVTGYK